MKHFYYSIQKVTKPSRSSWTGQKVTVNVYQCKKNIMSYVGECTWNCASYKGEDSEVLTLLMNKGLVSKKDYKEMGGYFNFNQRKYRISKI
jgi:hypothetical protein